MFTHLMKLLSFARVNTQNACVTNHQSVKQTKSMFFPEQYQFAIASWNTILVSDRLRRHKNKINVSKTNLHMHTMIS